MSLLKKNSTRGSLFKPKITPEFLVGQVKIRDSLLKSLSRAVKEVQLQFANQDPQGKETGAIGDCISSQHVCNAFEEVLKHGLKPSWFGKGPSTFWPVVQKVSRKQAVEYIGSLQYAQSDSAKCRGWIRMAVNECSLESYINVICQDSSLLSYYYEEYSFLRDPESVSALTQLLTGLSLITFKLTVDVRSLEFDAVPEAHSDVPLRVNPALLNRGAAKKPRRTTKDKEPDTHSTASSVSQDSIPTVPESTLGSNSTTTDPDSTGPGSTYAYTDSVLSGPNSIPASDGVSLDAVCNGKLLTASQQDLTEIMARGSDDGVWTDSDLLENEGGLKYDEEGGVEGAWRGSGGLEIEGETKGGISVDSDIGSGQEMGGAEEWGVESSLAGHMIDHVTDYMEEEEEEEEDVRGLAAIDASYQRLLEGHVEGGAGQEEHHREDQDNTGGDLQDRTDTNQLSQDVIGHDLQDTANDDLQDAVDLGYDLQDGRKLLDRHNTLVAEDQVTIATVTTAAVTTETITSLNPFSSPSPPLSPTNPFLDATPTPGGEGEGLNPFLSDFIESTNPFQELPKEARTNTQGRPLNPFALDSPRNSPPTFPPSNPFDVDDHAHADEEPRPPSSSRASPAPPSPNVPHTLPTPPDNQQDFPEDADDSNVSTLPDLPLPSAPGHALKTMPNLPGPSPEPTPEPTPKSVRANSDRPSSASTTRSRGTDDLESYSGSSIDISLLMETTPSGLNSPSHLISPEENFFASEMSSVEMQVAIDRLKVELAKSALDEGPDKDDMRKKIMALQVRLRQRKDEEEEMDQMTTSVGKEISGHKFYQQSRHAPVGRRRVCEGCGKRIRGFVHSWYLCKLCGFGYHKKCLAGVDRVCSGGGTASQDEETPSFILEVCPEKGLTNQHFRCASCNVAFNSTTIIARLCDYSGLYYCPSCHHNDQAVIPARVVHNWDFMPRKVCCKCCDLLDRQATKPLLKVRSINPLLYTYVQDLVTIEALRKDLLVMKTYFIYCPQAMEQQLLKRLDPFPHFKEGAKRFSLLDLQAVYNGDLIKQLNLIHSEFAAHIKRNCTICSGKGFSCALCHSSETLYPFDRRCRQCPKCRSIYHRNCYSEMTTCPKCSRTRHHKRLS